MQCAKCGKEIPSTSKFCPFCGASIISENTSPFSKEGLNKLYADKKTTVIAGVVAIALSIVLIVVLGASKNRSADFSDAANKEQERLYIELLDWCLVDEFGGVAKNVKASTKRDATRFVCQLSSEEIDEGMEYSPYIGVNKVFQEKCQGIQDVIIDDLDDDGNLEMVVVACGLNYDYQSFEPGVYLYQIVDPESIVDTERDETALYYSSASKHYNYLDTFSDFPIYSIDGKTIVGFDLQDLICDISSTNSLEVYKSTYNGKPTILLEMKYDGSFESYLCLEWKNRLADGMVYKGLYMDKEQFSADKKDYNLGDEADPSKRSLLIDMKKENYIYKYTSGKLQNYLDKFL